MNRHSSHPYNQFSNWNSSNNKDVINSSRFHNSQTIGNYTGQRMHTNPPNYFNQTRNRQYNNLPINLTSFEDLSTLNSAIETEKNNPLMIKEQNRMKQEVEIESALCCYMQETSNNDPRYNPSAASDACNVITLRQLPEEFSTERPQEEVNNWLQAYSQLMGSTSTQPTYQGIQCNK